MQTRTPVTSKPPDASVLLGPLAANQQPSTLPASGVAPPAPSGSLAPLLWLLFIGVVMVSFAVGFYLGRQAA